MGKVSYRHQKAPVGLYFSLLAGLPRTFARTANLGQPPARVAQSESIGARTALLGLGRAFSQPPGMWPELLQ